MPTHSLTFVVTTGRAGSSALSRILRQHPDILSLNELLLSMEYSPALSPRSLTGEEFWAAVTAPNPVFDWEIRSGFGCEEYLYPKLPRPRYSAATTGLPALSVMVLPHLSDDPDALLDALAPEVRSWPARPAPLHWQALFDALAEQCGSPRAVVERSGISLGLVGELRALFPHARFVHLHRAGPDCALSMSRHAGFRSFRLQHLLATRYGLGFSDLTERDIARLPPELASLMANGRPDLARTMRQELPPAEFGRLWSELIEEGVRLLEEVPHQLRTGLSYERLLDAPRTELTRLARFIGVSASPEWLAEASRTLDGTRRDAALRLPPAELAALHEACAPGTHALRTQEAADEQLPADT